MKFWFLGVAILFGACLALGMLLPGAGPAVPDAPPSPNAGVEGSLPDPDAAPQVSPSEQSDLLEEMLGEFSRLFDMLADLPPILLALFILVNNVITVVFSFGFAPFFGLVPLFVVGFNGWLIGVVVAGIVRTEGVGYAVKGLLPHGIIEIPAFLFAEAVALSFAVTLFAAFFNKEKRPQLFPSFVRHLKMLGIAAALLVPAALIEVYVTGRLIGA